MMWEYLIRNVSVIQDYRDELSEKELNNYGEIGWELVCVINENVIFKRKIENK